MELEETYGIAQYFSFMFNIVIPCALMFELPIVIAFLTALRLVTPTLLRKWRRYGYMLLVVLSTLVAPPDLLSNLFILVPFLLLFELSILLSAAIHKRWNSRNTVWNSETTNLAGGLRHN